jgi:hypothetical protein
MKRLTLFFLSLGILGATQPDDGRARDFDQACANVFPVAVQTMTAAGFEIKTSDAAGGVLQFGYAGQPMVYSFFVKHATPFIDKYTDNRRKHQGLTFTSGTFTFTGIDSGCRVQASIGIAVIDLISNIDPRKSNNDPWLRVPTAARSNGTAEREFLDAIAQQLAVH